MPLTDEDIILGARQLPNPEGIAPRLDTEGPPPTRLPVGAKLQPIPTDTGVKQDISNVDPAHAAEQPGMVREASAKAPVSGAGMSPMRDYGVPAPPDTMGQTRVAPSMQADPTLAPPSPERHQQTLKDFGNMKNIAAAQKLALDPSDPNYLQKLANFHAQEGMIKAEEAAYKEAHPWGTMENHPGFFGKLGHAFGTIGNVAGEALAPGLAEAIPGSHLNLEAQKAQGEQEIGKAVQQEGQLAGAESKEAGAEKSRAQAAIQPSIQQKNEAQAGLADAKTGAIELAGGKKVEKMSDGSLVEVTPNPDGSSGAKMIYKGDPKRQTEVKPIVMNGKPHQVLFDKNTGEQIADLGEAPQSPGADRGVTMIVPNAQGTGDVVRVGPGTKNIPLGAQTPSGFADLGRPTQQQRNAAGRATNAVTEIPNIINEINQLTPKIGLIAGRWNDFMQGKVGMEDADFAGLHQDLMMLSSAVALAHAVGRLPENLRLEFDHAINAPKQDPKNLIAVLGKVDKWMNNMRDQGIDPFTRAAEASGAKQAPGQPEKPANPKDPLGIL